MVNKAVILARGLGSRMRKASKNTNLSADQDKVASNGVKAMISVGRPFLDYVINELADAGFNRICLVIGPEHDIIRDYYNNLETHRVKIEFAVQQEPLGTANAVLAAEDFAGTDHILVINSDNLYPAAALVLLQDLTGSGLIGFQQKELVEQSNLPAERIMAFALVKRDQESNMVDIYEKPTAEMKQSLADDLLVSMNCWLCGPAIFSAAKTIPLSTRGEYELPDAVRAAIAAGDTYKVVPSGTGVLDLSNRDDINSVAQALKDKIVKL